MFVVNRKTVSFAINGKSNTDLAKKIRKAAVEMGGDPIYE
jgi:DNA-binding LacI/PurR family transcriptional regulator